MPYRLAFTEAEETDLLDDIDGSYHHILVAGGDGTVNYVVNMLKRRNLDLPVAVRRPERPTTREHAGPVPVGPSRRLPENSRRRDQTRRSGPGQRRVFRQRIQLRAFYRRLAKDADDTQEHLRQAGLLFRRARRTAQLPEDAHFDRVRRRQLRGTVADFLRVQRPHGRPDAFRLPVRNRRRLLDVIVIKGDRPIETVRTIFHFIKRNTKDYPAGIVHFKSRDILLHSYNEETTDIDGAAGSRFPVRIACEPGALRVICPQKKPKK